MELQLSAENVGQSGEAFAAANAIHKLLTKYNLSLDEITSGEDDEKDGLYISPKMQAHDEYGNWRAILMINLADRNYCRNLGNVKQPSIMMVVGKKENVEIVIQLYNRLSEIFLLKAKRGLIAKYEEEEGNMTLNQQNDYMESYLLGCVDGLMEHLDSVEKNTEEKFLAIRWKSKINSWEEKHANREGRIKWCHLLWYGWIPHARYCRRWSRVFRVLRITTTEWTKRITSIYGTKGLCYRP